MTKTGYEHIIEDYADDIEYMMRELKDHFRLMKICALYTEPGNAKQLEPGINPEGIRAMYAYCIDDMERMEKKMNELVAMAFLENENQKKN